MNKIFKTVSGIFVIMMLAKFLGQVREIMLAGYYGTGNEASAFLTASQIPLNFFDMILGLAIVSAFVPVFNEYLQKEGKESANIFADNFIGVVLVVSLVIAILGVVFSDNLIKLLASGFDDDTAKLASGLLKVMFPSLIFTAVAYSYAGIVQSFGEFKIPAAMSIASNLVAIVYFLLFNKLGGIYGLSVAMLVGWSLQLLILVPSLFKFKCKFRFSINFLHPGMKKVYKLAFPILLSSWVQPLNVMINTYLASFIDGGNAVSYINYANKLYLIIVGVFTMSVTNLILPELSRLFSDNKRGEGADVIANSLKSVVLFIMPIMAVFLVYSYDIVKIVYMRGAFDKNSAYMTSVALTFYSFGMLGYGVQEILNKSFYSMQDSLTPMKNAFLTIAVNVILSFLLYKKFGVAGLAFAAAMSATFSAVNLTVRIKKAVNCIKIKPVGLILVKSVLAVTIAVVTSIWVNKLLVQFEGGLLMELLILFASVLVLLFVYIVLLIIFRVDEFRKIFRKEVQI